MMAVSRLAVACSTIAPGPLRVWGPFRDRSAVPLPPTPVFTKILPALLSDPPVMLSAVLSATCSVPVLLTDEKIVVPLAVLTAPPVLDTAPPITVAEMKFTVPPADEMVPGPV